MERYERNTISEVPPAKHLQRNTISEPPPEKHHQRSTASEAPPAKHHQRSTTNEAPPTKHHELNTITRIGPSESIKTMTTKPISIEVIDAAGGNIGSLCRALERLGVEYTRVNGDSLPTGEKPLILPGVGNFGAVMKRLRDANLDARIKEVAAQGVPFLGICVGLQVLFDGSEESPGVEGLKLIEGNVVKFNEGKVPQIGWNNVDSQSPDWQSGFVYFVNSFYAAPKQPDVVLYQSDYFKPFCAAVKKGNITAFQFHPEKSGPFGISLLEQWLNSAADWKPPAVAAQTSDSN